MPTRGAGPLSRGPHLQFHDHRNDARLPERRARFYRGVEAPVSASRRKLGSDAERLRYLLEVTAQIAGSLDIHETLQRAVAALVPALADYAFVYALDGELTREAACAHHDPARQDLLGDLFRRTRPQLEDPAGVVARVARERRPLLVPRAGGEARDPLHDHPELQRLHRELGLRSYLVVPLVARDDVVGIAALARADNPQPFGPGDLALARQLATPIALALHHALLHDHVQRHDRRMVALAAASHAFAEAGLDFEEILRRLTRAVSEEVGDYCSVRLLSPDAATLDLVAAHHPSPGSRQIVEELSREWPISAHTGLLADVVRTGEPAFIPAADPRETRERLPPAFAAYHDQYPVRGLISVAMRAHDQVVGTMTVWREREGAPYQQHDRILLQDLADQAALAVDNARLYEASQEANRAKSSFLAMISHELRTPLNAVLGYADLMQMGIGGALPEPQLEQVGRIRFSAEHLRDIVDELIEYARLDAGQARLQLHPVRLAEVVRSAAQMIATQVRAKGLELRLEVPEDIVLASDPQRLRQVVLNLLTNAVAFTDEGRVRVDAEVAGSEVRLRVVDTGVGIAPEHLEEIFTPFWQAEQDHTRAVDGTGMGLSVSRRLARLLGGEIEVESAPGEGSTFALRLPVRRG